MNQNNLLLTLFRIGRGHPLAAPRKAILNRVKNGTCYYFDDTIILMSYRH